MHLPVTYMIHNVFSCWIKSFYVYIVMKWVPEADTLTTNYHVYEIKTAFLNKSVVPSV